MSIGEPPLTWVNTSVPVVANFPMPFHIGLLSANAIADHIKQLFLLTAHEDQQIAKLAKERLAVIREAFE